MTVFVKPKLENKKSDILMFLYCQVESTLIFGTCNTAG